MPTQLISVGVITSLLPNVIYALPARKCFIFSIPPTGYTISTSSDMNPEVAVGGTNATVAGGFIRSTNPTAEVVLNPV